MPCVGGLDSSCRSNGGQARCPPKSFLILAARTPVYRSRLVTRCLCLLQTEVPHQKVNNFYRLLHFLSDIFSLVFRFLAKIFNLSHRFAIWAAQNVITLRFYVAVHALITTFLSRWKVFFSVVSWWKMIFLLSRLVERWLFMRAAFFAPKNSLV